MQFPEARIGHQALVIENYMYIFGGFNGKQALKNIYRLNLDTLKWTFRGTMLAGNHFFSVNYYPKLKQVFIFGGCNNSLL